MRLIADSNEIDQRANVDQIDRSAFGRMRTSKEKMKNRRKVTFAASPGPGRDSSEATPKVKRAEMNISTTRKPA